MNKKEVFSIISEIKNFKNATGLKITDTHVHPFDVMGVVHFSETKNKYTENDYFSPGITEKLNYERLEKIGSKIYIKLFPNKVNKMIATSYIQVSEKRILEEMDLSLIDNAIFLPIEPWVGIEIIKEKFLSERFSILISIDIHKIKTNDIESLIKNFIIKYKVRGIKLHPNLQNFKPLPRDNKIDIAEKLDKIYRFADKENLYVLIHGGTSFFTNYINPKYKGYIMRSNTNGLINNFCDLNGKSELFNNYKNKFILAHLGNYGITNPNYNLIKMISQNYDNVSFDTAGCSSNLIKNVLNLIPSSKILFGSDAIYNKMIYNLAFTYLAIKKTNNSEKKEGIIFNIFQNNYKNL